MPARATSPTDANAAGTRLKMTRFKCRNSLTKCLEIHSPIRTLLLRVQPYTNNTILKTKTFIKDLQVMQKEGGGGKCQILLIFAFTLFIRDLKKKSAGTLFLFSWLGQVRPTLKSIKKKNFTATIFRFVDVQMHKGFFTSLINDRIERFQGLPGHISYLAVWEGQSASHPHLVAQPSAPHWGTDFADCFWSPWSLQM